MVSERYANNCLWQPCRCQRSCVKSSLLVVPVRINILHTCSNTTVNVLYFTIVGTRFCAFLNYSKTTIKISKSWVWECIRSTLNRNDAISTSSSHSFWQRWRSQRHHFAMRRWRILTTFDNSHKRSCDQLLLIFSINLDHFQNTIASCDRNSKPLLGPLGATFAYISNAIQ